MGRAGRSSALQFGLDLAAHDELEPGRQQAPSPDDYPVETNSSQVLMWNGVGGSTNVYGAIWPRYRPSDFRKGDEHGLQLELADYIRRARALL